MTGFFIKTAHSVSGPYTGVELREAALARIIFADTGLGASSDGPWTPAIHAGLFAENKTALPHPPGTHIPLFQVKGMPGAFQGPFKLRELIGFAARGMLPPDTLIQSDVSSEWVPAQRIHVLAACFSRKLFIPGVEPVAIAPVAKVSVAKVPVTDPEPIEEEVDEDLVDPVIAPPQWAVELEEEKKRAAAQDREEEEAAETKTQTEAHKIRLQLRNGIEWPKLSFKFAAIPLAIAAIVLVGFVWTQLGMSRSQIIGDWVHVAGGGVDAPPGFGVSFKEDGRCVIFNSRGESWTGDFEWVDRNERQINFHNMASISAVVADVGVGDQRDEIAPGDGYIKLSGYADQPPMIGERRFQRCYVRREGGTIRIGYLASVSLSGEKRSMEAGWIEAVPATSRPDIVADLKTIPKESPPAELDSRLDTPRHVSAAITVLDRITAPYGVGAYSEIVDGAYLLARFGVPDEARSTLTFEVPRIEWDPRDEPYPFTGFQTVRYGTIKFVLSPTGELRFIARAG